MQVTIEIPDAQVDRLRERFDSDTIESIVSLAVQELGERAAVESEVNLHVSAILDCIRRGDNLPILADEVIRVLDERASGNQFYSDFTIDPRIRDAFTGRGGSVGKSGRHQKWFLPAGSQG